MAACVTPSCWALRCRRSLCPLRPFIMPQGIEVISVGGRGAKHSEAVHRIPAAVSAEGPAAVSTYFVPTVVDGALSCQTRLASNALATRGGACLPTLGCAPPARFPCPCVWVQASARLPFVV
ncbi:hypothetical protein EON67_03355 [archaeon]|nr:MAG: hypothetical protein EON67_03355 [archaeon]